MTRGLIGNNDRDYSIIKTVETINRDTQSLARKRSMTRSRSSSRVRQGNVGDVALNTAVDRPKLPPSNRQAKLGHRSSDDKPPIGRSGWKTRRQSISRTRDSESRGPRNTRSDEPSKKTRGRSRSISRMRRVISDVFRGRSKSLVRRGSLSREPPRRGRSVNRREPPEIGPQAHDGSDNDGITAEVPKKNEIDTLIEHDVMKLDEKNTVMHVACLLHHTSAEIIDRLDENTSLAFELNNADELPLHYAAMDKQGVNHDVLKKLLTINPEAVKQRNVQKSLPIHLACMVGAPSKTAVKTLLKMYPKCLMMQSEFPLLFEREMIETVNESTEALDDEDDFDDFVAFTTPKSTQVSGLASYFACASPTQAELELIEESKMQRKGASNESNGPEIETGFSPLHLAVMNSAHPAIVELFVKTNPKCVHLKTSKGRTPLSCTQYIIRQHWLYGSDDDGIVKNSFEAIKILEDTMMKKEEEQDETKNEIEKD